MDEVNEHGDSPFLIACWEGHLDVVKFLFRVGSGSTANRMNANGDTPLAVAAWEGHLHIVTFLTAVGVELQVGKWFGIRESEGDGDCDVMSDVLMMTTSTTIITIVVMKRGGGIVVP